MTTTTEAMRLALEALELSKEQLAGDRLAPIACHAWPAGSGVIPEHDRAGTQALREYDECLSAVDAAITALRATLAAAPQPPAAQQGEAVSIRSGMCQRCGKWAGAHATLPGQSTDHLCRCQPTAAPQPVAQGDRRDKIIADLRSAHDRAVAQIERLTTKIAAMSAAAPAGVAPVKMSAVAKRKAADLGRQGYIIAGYTMTKPGARTAVLIDAAVRWLTPEQQHVLMHVEGSVIGAPAGVVGEPVALLAPNMNFGDPGEQKYLVLGAHTHPALRELMGAFPVYTAPPARQALTDEQVDEEWFEVHHLPINNVAKARLFARAIERAHGIGGKGGANG